MTTASIEEAEVTEAFHRAYRLVESGAPQAIEFDGSFSLGGAHSD